MANQHDRSYYKSDYDELDISQIRAGHIGKIYAFQVKIIKIPEARVEIVIAHYVCRVCGLEMDIEQIDEYRRKPNVCSGCNTKRSGDFRLIQDQSKYRDFQRIRVEEVYEKMPLPGHIIQTVIDVDLRDDAAKIPFKIGDQITIVGMVAVRPSRRPDFVKLYIKALGARL